MDARGCVHSVTHTHARAVARCVTRTCVCPSPLCACRRHAFDLPCAVLPLDSNPRAFHFTASRSNFEYNINSAVGVGAPNGHWRLLPVVHNDGTFLANVTSPLMLWTDVTYVGFRTVHATQCTLQPPVTVL